MVGSDVVNKDGKTLWHIQALPDENPYDWFVWSDGMPSREEVESVMRPELEEFGLTEYQIDDMIRGQSVYEVYTSEIPS